VSVDALLNTLPPDPRAPSVNGNGTHTGSQYGWQDDVITGPAPTERNNQLQKLVSRWVEKHMSETEIRLAAFALADKWEMNDAERDKLDKLIDRALDRGPQFSEEPEPDYLDTPVDPLADLIERATTPPDRSDVLSTGIAAIDNSTLGGMYPSQVWYDAAAAWVGKSVLWTQVSYHAATLGADVLYVSTEATPTEVRTRVMAQVFGYPASRILRIMSGQLKADAQDRRVMANWKVLSNWLDPLRYRFEVRDDLDTIDAIEKRLVERERRGRPVRVLVVDQLNDLSTPGLEGRFAIESISKGLKALARRHGPTVLACSQINRGNDTGRIQTIEAAGNIWVPDVFNLRETEVLRHHGHVLLFLGRNYTPAGDPRRLALRFGKVRGADVLPPIFELAYEPKYLKVSMPSPAPTAWPYVMEDVR
jgi:replicative DNA helicase